MAAYPPPASHASYSDQDHTEAMLACGYLFHTLHELENIIDSPSVVSLPQSYLAAMLYVPLSFSFPSEAFERALLDCIHARLTVYGAEGFDLFCRVCAKLLHNYIPQYSQHNIEVTQFFILSTAFAITPDEWFRTYQKPFLSASSTLCSFMHEFGSPTSIDRANPSAVPSASACSSSSANQGKKAGGIGRALLIALPAIAVSLVIAFIVFFSQRSIPSAPTPTPSPSIYAEPSTLTDSPETSAVTNPAQLSDTIDIPLSELDLKYVWVTSSGSRYHLRYCPKIKDSEELIRKPRGQGVYSNYNPCRVCNPDQVDWENAVFTDNSSSIQSGEDQLVPLSLPRNGRHYPTYDFTNTAFSSICVHAPTTLNCFVIVKRAGKDIILDRFFVRANETVDTFLPVGELDIFFAYGGDWYGTDLLFGESTSCQVDRQLDVSDAYGYEYTLYPVVDGNLTMPSVSMEEMLAG